MSERPDAIRPRPRDIIDLDALPEWAWSPRPDAAHLYQGRLWLLPEAGCVECAGEETARTLRGLDDADQFVCLTHGPLTPVPFVLERRYTVTLGGVTRSGMAEEHDFLLFPASMTAAERNRLIARILDETEETARTEEAP